MKDIKLNDIVGYWYIENGKLYYSIKKPNTTFATVKYYNTIDLIYYEIILCDVNYVMINTQPLTFKQNIYIKEEITAILKRSIYILLKTNILNDINAHRIYQNKPKIISGNIQ